MGFFSRRKEAESALGRAAETLSSQEEMGAIGEPWESIGDPLSRPAGASAMSALGGWSPELGVSDPEAALKAAQEALANSPLGSGPLSHLPMAKQIQEQLTAAMTQAQAMKSGGASRR